MTSSSGQQQPPPSPSGKPVFYGSSPTTPTFQSSDSSRKGYTLEEVHSWSESKVAEWLSQINFGRYRSKFIEHNITGSVLLDLDNEALKGMDIKTVGERVKLLVAIRTLRQECYAAVAVMARAKQMGHWPQDQRSEYRASPIISLPDNKHEGFNVTQPSKSSESKGLLNRSNSFSRLLGRSDSKRSMRSQDAPPMPPSPKAAVQEGKSFEGGIMSMEKVKQTCVKVFGEEGQTRIVNVHNATDAKAIMAKVLHKFGIEESSADKYCIFVVSSSTGEARALSDAELIEICRSTDRPEKERLILRKRHQYPTHEEFKRKGTKLQQQQQHMIRGDNSLDSGLPDKQMTLDIITGSTPTPSASSSSSSKKPPLARPPTRIRRFFGERPPSEVISSNLPSFFPNHKREVLETAGINAKRLSMTRSSSSLLGRPDKGGIGGGGSGSGPSSSSSSSTAVRNSVLPELVSVLGVDLGKFLEEEEEEEEGIIEEESSSVKSEEEKTDPNGKPSTSCTTSGEDDKNEKAKTAKTPTTISDENPIQWMKGALIGRGSFGDVYLGLNPISGELMAVKQVELPVENSATEGHKKSMVEALQREIALLKELQHENIVQYLGSQTDQAHFSIFLEYVPGGSVAGLLASYGAFQEPLVKSFVRQILKGLNYLHGKDIVHRDIKGANVLVDNKGGVKISDFGISKKVEEDIMQISSSAPHRPSLQGSIFWMAPEVVKQTHYTRKADVWSLGCMVVEMFTGDHPFPEFSQMQAIFKIGSYTSPTIPENISPEAKDFLRCTFKLNHEERPTAKELLEHPFLIAETE